MKVKIICCLIFLSLVFCSCNKTEPQLHPPVKLETPIVKYEKGVISWNKVKNADKYELSINNRIEISYDTQYFLDVTTESKLYYVKVKAITESEKFLNSDFSTTFSFHTFALPTPFITSSEYNEEKTEATYIINFETNIADYYKLFINNNYICQFDQNNFIIKKQQLINGSNHVVIQACSNNAFICDSFYEFELIKQHNYEDFRIQNGNLIYSKYNTDFIYNTDSFLPGEYEIIIINHESSSPYPFFDFSSDGSLVTIKKLFSPKVLDCRYIKEQDSSQTLFQIYLKLELFGPACNRIEIITNEYSDTHKSYLSDPIHPVNNIVDYLFTIEKWSIPSSIDIVLHKDEYISSNRINAKFNK